MGGAPLEREETVDALGVLCEILHCKRCYVCILGFAVHTPLHSFRSLACSSLHR